MLSASSEFNGGCYENDKYKGTIEFSQSNTIKIVASQLTLKFWVHIFSSFILPFPGQYNDLGPLL